MFREEFSLLCLHTGKSKRLGNGYLNLGFFSQRYSGGAGRGKRGAQRQPVVTSSCAWVKKLLDLGSKDSHERGLRAGRGQRNARPSSSRP